MKMAFGDVERQAYTDQSFLHERLAVVSPEHGQTGIWTQSAEKTGARIIASRGGLKEEISITHFTVGDRFLPVIRTYESLPIENPGRDLHIKGGVAFAIAPEYLESMQEHLKPGGAFGERLIQMSEKLYPQQSVQQDGCALIPSFA